MNNCRAGLYSFAPTATWLRKTGMASPPSLVVLGLALPDSRILSGIAGIGLTFANIATILPHLRQPLLDSMRNAQSSVPTLASSSDRECESLPLDSNTILKSAITEPLGCLDIDSKTASYTTLALSDDTTDDDQASPQGPLSIPDETEVACFDSTKFSLSTPDPQQKCTVAPCGEPEECTTDQQVASAVTTIIKVPDRHYPAVVDVILDLPDVSVACDDTVQSGLNEPCAVAGKEALEKRRPESLEFIPQSVIRRYPFGNRASGGRHADLVQNPDMFLEEAKPRVSCSTLEWHGCSPPLAEVQRREKAMAETTLVIETVPAQDPFEHGPTSLLEPLTTHEQTRLRKCLIRRRRPGILARASIRNRRSTVREYKNDPSNELSSSDSDSESDNESQDSSGSSEDESMLPHMLGADLIAAINSNSESEPNLLASRKTIPPLDIYGDFLFSEDSAEDISLQVSSNDGASDGEIKAPATSRALTHDDIQRWATGVVQKYVRQVCHSRFIVEPSSPSQVSDVCAERPSGSGISQCPLSGLHCKLGGATSAGIVPPSSTIESLPTLSILPQAVRNIHDIPEFVPRQRYHYHEVITRCADVPSARNHGMKFTIDVTRDAATQAIAKVESQVRFNARQRLAGVDEGRIIGMDGG